MSNVPRYPLALTLAQLNDLKPLLDAVAAREGYPDAPVFVLQGLVRTARRAARSGELAAHLNAPKTLQDARLQVQAIVRATNLQAVALWWAWAGGYFAALLQAQLIDEATKRVLELEADAARDAWTEPTVTHHAE